MDRYPKMLNVILILSLITLTAISAFLISDILSFGSESPENELFSTIGVFIPKESIAAISNWKESGMKLINLDKSEESVNVSFNGTAASLSAADDAAPLKVANTSNEEERTSAAGDNLSRLDLAGSSNASQNKISISSEKIDSTAVGNSADRKSSSKQPAKIEQYKSSKNDSIQLETASPADTASQNNSQTSQSRLQINLSSNVTEIFPAVELESEQSNSSLYQLYTKTVGVSINNSSIATADYQTNLSKLNSSKVNESQIPPSNDEYESELPLEGQPEQAANATLDELNISLLDLTNSAVSNESNASQLDLASEVVKVEPDANHSDLPDNSGSSDENASQPETEIDATPIEIYPATIKAESDLTSDYNLAMEQTSETLNQGNIQASEDEKIDNSIPDQKTTSDLPSVSSEQTDLNSEGGEAPEETESVAPASSDQVSIQESNNAQARDRNRQVRSSERSAPSSRSQITRNAEDKRMQDNSNSEGIGSKASTSSPASSEEPQKDSSNARSEPIRRPKRPEKPSRTVNPR